MEVIHSKESDNFVAIGGEKAARFKVAASAAAFRIMSDTLYRDKERAAAREIICNAVDAHIEAGTPDVPVEITLTDDELIVKDQGLGIPHAKIEDIYCTLFGSQKAQDKRVTGGFGLGSKAPFSITDHFTVTSCNQGTKSLYAMVASDPEEEGCPSAKRMMQTGTMDQGLTVSVPLRPGQRRKIEDHVISIAKEGGMAVRLNGKLIETPDFRGLREKGFGLIANVPQAYGRQIRVLYANVLYPLDAHPELDAYVRALSEMNASGQSWIFYAKPSTIGITPAREALSYDEETIVVLKALLKAAVEEVSLGFRRAMPKVLDECVKHRKRHELAAWATSRNFPDVMRGNLLGGDEIGRAVALAKVWSNNVPQREVARAMARRFKDHGRGLRRVASKTYPVRSRRYHPDTTLADEQANYVMRRVVRAVGTEAAAGFYRRDSSTGALMSPRKPQLYRHKSDHYPLALHIGPNNKSLQSAKQHGYFLSTLKLSDAIVDRVRARCKKLGIEVVEIAKTEPEKRAKKPKEPEQFGPPCPPLLHPFASFANSTSRHYGSYMHDLRVKALDSPRYFVADALYTAQGAKSHNTKSFVGAYVSKARMLPNLVRKHIGNVAVITHRDELAGGLAAGAPRLERLVLDKLQARVKRRKPYESFYARLAMFGLGELGSRSGDTSFARGLVLTSREHAHVALRERYSANPDRDEAYELWILANLLFKGRAVEKGHMDAEEARLMLPMFAEWRALAQPLEVNRFGEELPWLRTEHLELIGSAFSHRDVDDLEGPARDDFIHIIAELGRRHDARKQKETAK